MWTCCTTLCVDEQVLSCSFCIKFSAIRIRGLRCSHSVVVLRICMIMSLQGVSMKEQQVAAVAAFGVRKAQAVEKIEKIKVTEAKMNAQTAVAVSETGHLRDAIDAERTATVARIQTDAQAASMQVEQERLEKARASGSAAAPATAVVDENSPNSVLVAGASQIANSTASAASSASNAVEDEMGASDEGSTTAATGTTASVTTSSTAAGGTTTAAATGTTALVAASRNAAGTTRPGAASGAAASGPAAGVETGTTRDSFANPKKNVIGSGAPSDGQNAETVKKIGSGAPSDGQNAETVMADGGSGAEGSSASKVKDI